MVFFIILYQMNCDSYVSTDTYPIDKLCFSRKCFFFFFKIYLFLRDTEKEAETQAEEEAGFSREV